MPRLATYMFATLSVPVLALGLSVSGAAYGEIGSGGQNAPNRQNTPPAKVNAQVSADASMPRRLDAYKAAYVAAQTAMAEARKYHDQYQMIAAMTEPDFAGAFPGADYRATLNNLAQKYQDNQALADAAQKEAIVFLNSVTADRPITAQGLAELHQMLGL